MNKEIAEQATSFKYHSSFQLTLGGDHSIAIGTISSLMKKYPDLGIVWVDAHADINTQQTT